MRLMIYRMGKTGERVIYECWYQYMKNILDKICEIYEIDDECKELLYKIHMRPNDYLIYIIPK